MSPEYVVKLGQDMLMLVLLIGGPILAVALIVGLGVSIFQAVTQIHEMTLTFIPKIVAVGVTVVLILPWALQQIVDFTSNLLRSIPTMVG
ncbi:MAG: flagellar biosynthesis protein FliQ [Candidatus Latescibacterota bacterium]|nr:flagellar biosynthesis protein FliQ [Candidatus Latescibacterota bacterium]